MVFDLSVSPQAEAMPWWGRTNGRKKWVFPVAFDGKFQYRIAFSCAEHSVPTGLGEIKQLCPRQLSGRGLVSNFFWSSAFLSGKIKIKKGENMKEQNYKQRSGGKKSNAAQIPRTQRKRRKKCIDNQAKKI